MRYAFQRTILLWRLRRMIALLDRSARTAAPAGASRRLSGLTRGYGHAGRSRPGRALCTVRAHHGRSLHGRRRRHRSEFTTRIDIGEDARSELVELLNARLADAFDLYGQAKQAHWIVRGSDFFQLHELYDGVAEAVLPLVDEIAERVGQLGGAARGTVRMAAEATSLDEYPRRRDRRLGDARGRRRPAGGVRRGHARRRSTARRSSATSPRPTCSPRRRARSTSSSGSSRRTCRPEGRRSSSADRSAVEAPHAVRLGGARQTTSSASSARNASDSSSSAGRCARPRLRARARRRSAAPPGVQADSPDRHSSASHDRSSSYPAGLSKSRRTTSCGATVPFQRFSLSRKTRS